MPSLVSYQVISVEQFHMRSVRLKISEFSTIFVFFLMFFRKQNALFGFGTVFLALCVTSAHGARILGLFPTPCQSHTIIHAAAADALARAGHNVTVIGVSKNFYPNAAYKYIQIELGDGAHFDRSTLAQMIKQPQSFYQNIFNIVHGYTVTGNLTLSHPKMREFLRKHGEGAFDLVLLGYALNDYTMGLGAHFRCPIVASFMIQPIFATNRLIGNPAEESHVPLLFTSLKQPLNFWERFVNFLANLLERWVLMPIIEWDIQKVYNVEQDFQQINLYITLTAIYSKKILPQHKELLSQRPVLQNLLNLVNQI
ncbi:UDP-glycosyltransferase UGT4-like [Eurosta solidaginis]|uniref:UDP-glycosyltransferase UGT4-like n=1 Tax=Eurosta solidaginis TaxID=178769 RepID=UPI0035314F00